MHSFSILAVLAAAASPAVASSLPSGTFVREMGTGTLVLEAQQGGDLRFRIDADPLPRLVPPPRKKDALPIRQESDHACSLQGTIAAGKHRGTVTDATKGLCVIAIEDGPRGIDVSTEEQPEGPWHALCGGRPVFEGLYRRPAPGCEPKAVESARRESRTFYEQKRFAEAEKAIAPIVGDCERFVSEVAQGELQNDMARALHGQGHDAACLKALRPLKNLLEMTEPQIREAFPADADARIALVKATQANLSLCGAKRRP